MTDMNMDELNEQLNDLTNEKGDVLRQADKWLARKIGAFTLCAFSALLGIIYPGILPAIGGAAGLLLAAAYKHNYSQEMQKAIAIDKQIYNKNELFRKLTPRCAECKNLHE